ncbi:origin recognition complex subunit 2 [Rhodnius prolixus]|uniref:origin recognition complex subunit 2 n=1 Tax=Rhodnius prolixus TaxID=13249 RepID=UPI003D18E117
MLPSTKKNKQTSSDENESEGNEENNDLESSYELFTPIKTRSYLKSGSPISPIATHTRSGRKIKRIQYLDFESEFNDIDNQKSLTNKSKDQISGKSSALKELNTLKEEFNDLRISSSTISTPTTRSRIPRVKETPVKGNGSPRGNLISPDVVYSRSGRKIKKIQYSENVPDSASPKVKLRKSSLRHQHSLKKDNGSKTEFITPSKKNLIEQNNDESGCAPRWKNVSFPMKTKSQSNLENLNHKNKIEMKNKFEDMEVCSQDSPLRKKSALLERNDEIRRLGVSYSPSKNKISSKLSEVPKENASPDCTYTKSGRKIKKKRYLEESYQEDSNQETESSDEEVPDGVVKPPTLYDDENAVEMQIFGFQTPKRRNAMLDKASRSASKLNNVQKTPKSNKSDKINEHKTPYNMRKRLKKGIAKEVTRQSVDALLEDSGSDYVPSSSSSSSDVSEDEEDKDSEESSDGYEVSGVIPLDKATEPEQLIKRKRRAAINHFIFTSEDYFENKNLRSLTSNHTLSQLKTPRFNQGQLCEILKSVGSKHEKAINELNLENEAMFSRWLLSMNEGFNILVYGVGSKKKLLNVFHRQFLSRCYVAVINGYFPGLVLKDILDCITNDVLKLRSIPSQPHDIVELIGTKLRNRNNRLFLLVHNIDGAALRCDKIQSVLAHLASNPNIHLLATLDHINSPLLWDQNKLSLFNFTWEDGTSFLPYSDETSYESSLMVQQSGGIALAGLKNIFKSLNTNSRKIFKLLLEHQLEDKSNKSQGMLFSDLYRECRNSFLVSSDLALRTQLTEFFDHQLVKWKKDNEHLVVPLDSAVLKQFQNYLLSENSLY